MNVTRLKDFASLSSVTVSLMKCMLFHGFLSRIDNHKQKCMVVTQKQASRLTPLGSQSNFLANQVFIISPVLFP